MFIPNTNSIRRTIVTINGDSIASITNPKGITANKIMKIYAGKTLENFSMPKT